MPRRCRSLSVSSHSEPHAGGVLTNLTVLAVLSGLPLRACPRIIQPRYPSRAQPPGMPQPPPEVIQATLEQLLQEAERRASLNLLHVKMLEAELATARARATELEAKLPTCKP